MYVPFFNKLVIVNCKTQLSNMPIECNPQFSPCNFQYANLNPEWRANELLLTPALTSNQQNENELVTTEIKLTSSDMHPGYMNVNYICKVNNQRFVFKGNLYCKNNINVNQFSSTSVNMDCRTSYYRTKQSTSLRNFDTCFMHNIGDVSENR